MRLTVHSHEPHFLPTFSINNSTCSKSLELRSPTFMATLSLSSNPREGGGGGCASSIPVRRSTTVTGLSVSSGITAHFEERTGVRVVRLMVVLGAERCLHVPPQSAETIIISGMERCGRGEGWKRERRGRGRGVEKGEAWKRRRRGRGRGVEEGEAWKRGEGEEINERRGGSPRQSAQTPFSWKCRDISFNQPKPDEHANVGQRSL